MEESMYNAYSNSNDFDLPALLEPYTKEELYSMVLELAEADRAIYQVILNRISTDTKWCKLFVHGLAFNTTKQSLMRTFQQYGAVKEAVVLLEQHDRSKGCGFVIFENATSAQWALSSPVFVDGREVQCDYAFKGNPRKVLLQNQPVISPEQRLAADGRRLFIHDLAWKTTNDTLRRAFLKYGDIQEAVVIHDRKTGKSKGFGFVTFFMAESARKALQEPAKRIDGRNAKVAYAKATKDANVSVTPFQSRSPSPIGGPLPRESSAPMRELEMLNQKRPSLNMNEMSGRSNVSCNGSIGSIAASVRSHSTSSACTVPSYSMNSTPNQLPMTMFTANPISSGSWLPGQLGYPALITEHSAQGGTPQVTPVLAPMVPHPSFLPLPPHPKSFSIEMPSGQVPMQQMQFSQELNLQQVQQGAYTLVNVGMLPSVQAVPTMIMQQSNPRKE